MKVVSIAQMRDAEQFSMATGVSGLELMENAGVAAAKWIQENLLSSRMHCTVLCGAGNNGGDGFVVARKLVDFGAKVAVILVKGDPCTEDAMAELDRLPVEQISIFRFLAAQQACVKEIKNTELLIDAAFGTGFHGEVQAPYCTLFDEINRANCLVCSLDMPSGANADTGFASEYTVQADVTITFAAVKKGQLKSPAFDFCGKLQAVDIGIPEQAFKGKSEQLLDLDFLREVLPKRKNTSNKGTFGHVLCICGSKQYPGAALLSGSAAARCGAGLVTVAAPESIWPVLASRFKEVMLSAQLETSAGSFSLSALENILSFAERCSAVLIGCGLTQNEETKRFVCELLLRLNGTVVVDADGLNACVGHIDVLQKSKANLILTPHPGEMGRLCGLPVKEIQRERAQLALTFAKRSNTTVVLKGAGTVIATPDGQIFRNLTGNPGLAKGGSGDILAGMIAGLIAQGIPAVDAACAGVHLHGLAADRCAEKKSQYAMLPSDILSELPALFCDLSL